MRCPGHRGGNEAESSQAHGREGAGQALRQAEAEVNPRALAAGRPLRNGEQRGDGPRLGQPEAPVAGDGPFNVLRRSEILLHLAAQGCKFRGLLVREAGCGGPIIERQGPGSASGNRPDRDAFVTQPAFQHPPREGVNDEMVRVHGAGHHGLPQPRARIYHGLVPPAGQRIGGEEHTGGGCVHHPLNHDGERHRGRIDPAARPVADGPVRPE